MIEIPVVKSILSIIFMFLNFIWKIFKPKEGNDIYIPVPNRTIIVAPNPESHNTFWHMGNESGKDAMQVVGRLKVTNITKYNVALSAVKMRNPSLLGRIMTKHMGHIMVKDQNSNYHGMYQIPSGCMSDISFDLWITPPFKKQGEPFTTDVAIIDQFGNEHWVKRVNFEYC